MFSESWYHGTPDSREIEKMGGFNSNTITVDYVTEPLKLKGLQREMIIARESGNMSLYHILLNKVDDFKKDFIYKKPLFLSDKYNVAKTYADPHRAFDYQSAVEKVYEVEVDCDKIAKIIATGDRFRFINIEKVKQGFINSGTSEKKIDKLIAMFNYYTSDSKGIKTDVIAAIGNILGFDCIDVIGVLDSYHGGNVKSIIRMVLDPSKARLKKTLMINENIENYKTVYRGQPFWINTYPSKGSIWVTYDYNFAKEYGEVKEFKMPKNLNILDTEYYDKWEVLVDEFDEDGEYEEYKYQPTDEFILFLKSKGYDGFVNGNNILVFDKTKLKY
jgi:hypothetical protein